MMAPAALFAPIVVGGLWLLAALKYQALFAPLFIAKTQMAENGA